MGRTIGTIVLAALFTAGAQGQEPTPPVTTTTATPAQTQPNGQQQQTPDVGGPQSDTTPMIIRKKPELNPKPEPKPEKPKHIEGMPQATFRVQSALVDVDVSVVTKDGMFVPGLKQGNFKIYEDGTEQKVTHFAQTEKPITAVLLVEFAANSYYFINDMLNAAYTFTDTLKKEDYVAVVSFDMKPQMIVDFTHDKNAVRGALNQLRIPGFSETNVFDALYDTIDRLERVEGHKYIILISSGVDTFSKLNLDKTLKKVQGSKDITIYAISTGQAIRLITEEQRQARPWGGADNMTFLQADNEMKTFAKLTGGKAYFPRFAGEMPEIFGDIAAQVRNQYSLTYQPTDSKLDGTYRKLKVELVGPDGDPLKMVDQKGHKVKYEIIARDGYRAAHEVE